MRRLHVSDGILFVTCNVLRTRTGLTENEFALLAEVFDRVRRRRGFLLGGFVFMPDHWHALILPAAGDTLPRVMGALKIAANRAINRSRRSSGPFWQARYFDRALRTVKEFHSKLEYIHLNPVKRGLTAKPEEWVWSSFHSYGGPGPVRLRVDVLNLPMDQRARL